MAKYVRKLNRDDSGYNYEEVKSNIVKDEDEGSKYVKCKIMENSMLKNALKDAQNVRKEIFKNKKEEIEKILVRESTSKLKFDAKRNTCTLDGKKYTAVPTSTRKFKFDALTNTYTLNDLKYTAEYLNDIGLNPPDTSLNCDYMPSRGISSPECVSGSISIIDIDDSKYFKTASVSEDDSNHLKSASVSANYAVVREVGSHHSTIIVSE